MVIYFFIFNFIGIVAIAHALYFRYYALLVFNLLIVLTYCFKPILSCAGYFVGYNGCADGLVFESMVIFVVLLPFFLGQFISLGSHRLQLTIARPPVMVEGLMLPVVLLVLLIGFNWIGSDSFHEFDQNRVAQAEGAGFRNLFLGSITVLVVISIRYKSFLYTILIAVLLFVATSTKQMMFFPFLLFFADKFKDHYSKIAVLKVGFLMALALVGAQIFRAQGNFDIDIGDILYAFAVPFDAYDNAITIIHTIYDKNIFDVFLPNDFHYFIESFLNFVPRAIWFNKPEIQGFWRIQRDYLPDLFTGTLGMSVSTSLPVDILLSFGLVIGSIVLFLFSRFLKLVDLGAIRIGFIYPLLLSFAVEFSRGGFRNVGMQFLQVAVIWVLLMIVRLFVPIYHSLKKSSFNTPYIRI